MMHVTPIPIDSEVLGGTVLSLHDVTLDEDFAAVEARYLAEYHPVYVSGKLSFNRLAEIHRLEDHGFRVVECQLKAVLPLRKERELPVAGYGFAEVTSEETLAPVLEIAGIAFTHDRYTIDPGIAAGLAGERYRRYVRQSFERPDEAVFRLFDEKTGRTLAFKTHRYLENGEALLLLGGVHPDYQALGLGAINAISELNLLVRRGVRKITTHFSAVNYPILALEVSRLGYKIVESYAVLRKLYKDGE